MNILHARLHGLIDLLTPPLCLICGIGEAAESPNHEALCRRCSAALLPEGQDPTTLLERTHHGPERSLVVAAIGPHTGPLAEAVAHLKFQGCTTLAPILARRMCTVIPPGPWGLVVPIPVHQARLRHRPVGQANLLAAAIAHRLRIPFAPALQRTDPSAPRVTLDALSRRTQRPTFALRPKRTPVTARRILLIDDVATTGLTLNAAARVLWEAGAERVGAVVISSNLLENWDPPPEFLSPDPAARSR